MKLEVLGMAARLDCYGFPPVGEGCPVGLLWVSLLLGRAARLDGYGQLWVSLLLGRVARSVSSVSLLLGRAVRSDCYGFPSCWGGLPGWAAMGFLLSGRAVRSNCYGFPPVGES